MAINLRFYALLIFIAVTEASCSAARQQSGNTDGYTLVWADEFNVDGRPDPSNWKFENGYVRNEELQWYQESNAFCKDGLLVIEARKEERLNPQYVEGSRNWKTNRPLISHTSSSINTSGKKQWLYGRFEMRGKIDIRSGLWPAWWTLGVTGRWPANGEIDIMEYYRGRMLANVACIGPDKKPQWFSNTFSTDSMGGARWAEAFHTWR
ncbi:MAG: glycoside hydrolase family 16 protein, partial [Chitinophagaceae bacterium]